MCFVLCPRQVALCCCSDHSICAIFAGAIAGLFTAYVVYKWRNRDYIGFTEQVGPHSDIFNGFILEFF